MDTELNKSNINLWSTGKPSTGSEGYTISYKVYIPESMIKNDCYVRLFPAINFFDAEHQYLNSAFGRNVELLADGRMVKYDPETDKKVDVDYASVEKANGYRVVSYNDKVLSQDIPENVKKASTVGLEFHLEISGSNITAENQAVYLDDVKIAKADGTVVYDQNFDAATGNIGIVNVVPKMESTDAIDVTTTTLPSLTSTQTVTKTLKVAKTSLSVKVGKKVTIKATVKPKAKITYKSSNKKIATVTSKGVVTGKKAGKAVITVKGNGKTVKVKVTVKGKK